MVLKRWGATKDKQNRRWLFCSYVRTSPAHYSSRSHHHAAPADDGHWHERSGWVWSVQQLVSGRTPPHFKTTFIKYIHLADRVGMIFFFPFQAASVRQLRELRLPERLELQPVLLSTQLKSFCGGRLSHRNNRLMIEQHPTVLPILPLDYLPWIHKNKEKSSHLVKDGNVTKGHRDAYFQ